ncbi:MAG: ABC transporter ATP-binding protein [Pseudomonadota bacterium]
MTEAPLVQIDELELSFTSGRGRWSPVVKGVSIAVHAGEIVGLVGESGSGKSVTAMSIPQLQPRGISQITGGRVALAGRCTSQMSPSQLRSVRGGDVSVVFQEPMTSLNPTRRIQAQLIEAIAANTALDKAQAKARAKTLLLDVRIRDRERVLRAYPFELSGGMRQRVMLAIAFAADPKLLIADEPTTALDVTVQAEVLALIRDLALARGAAVLFISHDLAVVSQLCDRVYVMRQGEIVEAGQVTHVLTSPSHSYTRGLLDCLPEGHEKRARLPAPGVAPCTGSEQHVVAGGQVIALEEVSVAFTTKRDWRGRATEAVQAVKSASFNVRRGETFSLIGESGSGKTTLARTIMGLQPPSSGAVTVLGRAPLEAARSGRLQMIYQDPRSSLNPRMPVWQIVTEPLKIAGFRSDRREKAKDLLDRSGLAGDVLEKGPREFSGGERQRIAIARALSTDPEILVLDEPTSALDASVQAQILNLLLDLQDARGLTYFLISHDMSVVAHMSDRIAVMRTGEIVELGFAADKLQNPQTEYLQSLLKATPRLIGA